LGSHPPNLSPDKRALWPSELRPHRKSRGRDSNPRSRAHEAREDNRSSTAQGQPAPSAGLEPAASGLRARRHHQLRPRGRANTPAAGIEPAVSRVTTARLSNSTTPDWDRRKQQTEAAGLEPASGCGRLRDSNAPPFQLGHASRKAEGEGVEPPKPEGPPVFGTGYRADGSPSEQWPRQASNLHPPG
jgi:hypothetical protein